jgi:hypothetical protein
MKRSIICILLLINILSQTKYFEISYFPSDVLVEEEQISDTIIHHQISTNFVRFNNFPIYEIREVLFNNFKLTTNDFIENHKKLPGVQIEFKNSGEYLLTLVTLSNKCSTAHWCKIIEKHLMNVNVGVTMRFLSEDISTGSIIAIVFCVTVIVIVLLIVLLLFNMKKIKKWWYGKNKEDSKAYFPNLEESPNDVPYPFANKTKSIELA